MPDKELLERVEDRLVTEETAYLDVMEHGSSISTLHKTQRKLLQELQKVGASEDLETILLAEVLILKNERRLYADKRVMKSSLDNALNEIEAAMLLVNQIKDPAAYKSVADVYFHSHKVLIRGLPNDGARLFFKSHDSRLTDLEKARLMGIDKELIGVRKKNLKGLGRTTLNCRKTHSSPLNLLKGSLSQGVISSQGQISSK